MSTVDLSLVREFKRRAEAALPGRVARVVLFGSRARGEARAESDWDVAVFLRDAPTANDRATLSDIGFDLLLARGERIQTIALDVARADEPSWLLETMRRDGVAA